VWVVFSVIFVVGLGKFFVELVTEVIGLPTAGLLGIPIVGLVTGVAGLMMFPA